MAKRVNALMEDRKRILMNTPHTAEASGEIASFRTDMSAKFKELTAEIVPVQDLHGYDHPWPAGGGVQLIPYPYRDTLPLTKNGITFTDIGNGRIHAQGTATSITYFNLFGNALTPIPSWVKPNTQYTLRPLTVSSKYFLQFILYGSPTFAISGRTFTTPNDFSAYTGFAIVIGVYNGAEINTDIFPMLEYGSVAHDFAPYSNICPISGWSEAKVTRTGKNLLPYPYYETRTTISGLNFTDNGDGTITADGTPTSTVFYNLFTNSVNNSIRLKAGTYKISAPGDSNIQWNWYRVGGELLSSGSTERTFTLESDAYVYCFLRFTANAQFQNVTVKPMLMLSTETDLTYEPYQGEKVTVQLGQTVYGGTLDVRRGKVRVTKGVKVLDGSENYLWHNSGVAYTAVPNGITTDAVTQFQRWTICDKLQSASWTERGRIDNCCGIFYGSSYVFIKSSDNFSDAASAKAWVADNPLTVVYELATPFELTVTPEAIKALVGDNNVWADTGEVGVKFWTHLNESGQPASLLGANLALFSHSSDIREEIIEGEPEAEINGFLEAEKGVTNGETEME